jgi:hypothetical protein
MAAFGREGDRAFAVNQAGQIRGLLERQAVDLDCGCHAGINASAPEKKTATEGVAVKLVEAAGQPVRPFRDGLDYAFILVPRMRSVLSGRNNARS